MTDVRFADCDDISADYQELLDRGYVLRRYANPLGWISAINAEGRADGLRLDSTLSPIDPHVGWAILRRAGGNDPMYETARIMLLCEIALQVSVGESESDHLLD